MIPHAPIPSAVQQGVGIARARAFDGVAFQAAVKGLLEAAGFAADTTHLKSTPQRVAELWERRLLGGYDVDPAVALGAGFEDGRADPVIIRGIAIHGVCPHHLVPFRGVAHVAYIPGGRLHGFGRVARMVDALSHRLTYQEWFTRDVVEALTTHGLAAGAACQVDAEQLCLLLGEDRRGDERVVTQAFAGVYSGDSAAAASRRGEFLAALPGAGR